MRRPSARVVPSGRGESACTHQEGVCASEDVGRRHGWRGIRSRVSREGRRRGVGEERLADNSQMGLVELEVVLEDSRMPVMRCNRTRKRGRRRPSRPLSPRALSSAFGWHGGTSELTLSKGRNSPQARARAKATE